MNRPDITKKTIDNDEKPYRINPKYVQDLEKYCDELEEEYKLLKGDYEDQKAIFTDVLYEATQKLEKYKKALDKTCGTLVNMKNVCDCVCFVTCPFKKECSVDMNNGDVCNDKNNWEE